MNRPTMKLLIYGAIALGGLNSIAAADARVKRCQNLPCYQELLGTKGPTTSVKSDPICDARDAVTIRSSKITLSETCKNQVQYGDDNTIEIPAQTVSRICSCLSSTPQPGTLDRRDAEMHTNAAMLRQAINDTVRGALADIEKQVTIGPQNVPGYETAGEEVWSMELIPQYQTPIRLYHHYLLKGGHASIDFVDMSEFDLVNEEDTDTTIQVGQSTSVEEPSTEGWSVGAKCKGDVLTLTGNKQALSRREPKISTKKVAIERACKAHTRCKVMTLTLHLRVEGECLVVPIANALGQFDYGCQSQNFKIKTSETNAFRRSWCPYKTRECAVRTPVYNEDGTPKTMVVFVTANTTGTSSSGLPQVEVVS